jgi:CheY-like chemotaxis protein/HPt (histidine-containing phosphotransfer) domain-containing protein
MNAIIGMAELALREDMSEAAREHTLTIKQAGTDLLSIINDILDFSKIEAGSLEIVPREYQLSSLIHDVVSIIKTWMFDSRLRLLVNVDSNIPNSLYGDEIRIRQIILNLLSNAIKYTEKGFVSFSVFVETTDGSSIVLRIEVADSGKGIREEDIGKLFREFSQFDMGNNMGIEGTGLGLAITRNLVGVMGGKVDVSSKYGEGSLFTVKLKQNICNPEKLAVVENPQEKRTLVFERREICSDSISRTMDNLGVNCTIVDTASEFYERLQSGEYSFVFVAANLYQSLNEAYPSLKIDAKITLVAEFGETFSSRNLTVLYTPIYCIPVANIMNGGDDKFSYGDSKEAAMRFTAPEAKILIVDDINTNLKVAEGLMLPYNMKVELCGSGVKAVEAVKGAHYDLVFMDHKMPGMDGMEATAAIRAWEKEKGTEQVLIIALTANAVTGTREMFLANGFNDFLSKPIDMVKLNAVLERWIPKEKQKSGAVRIKEPQVFPKIEIEGLDTEKGLFIAGGRMEIYLETLAYFYRDGQAKIREIGESLEAKDLSLYAIYTHGLKSAAANIGAVELSQTAKALEAAGASGDSGYIEAHNAKFIEDMESLLNGINGLITAQGGKAGDSFDREELKSELETLKTALEELDGGLINKTVDNLRKYAEAHDGLIRSISEKVLVAEYDEAIALIDTLLI